ncbi:MAG: hypothetical protein JSY10_03780 [Paenibacillus sp.]|nr:hypothetical protein [Paenibacillus sp.]
MKQIFQPYQVFQSNKRLIEEFENLTHISYGLAQQLLNKYPKEEILPLDESKIDEKQLSYTPADVKVDEFEVICRWINYNEYASKLEITDFEEFMKDVVSGKYGPIETHPNTGEQLLIWPMEYSQSSIEDLPEPGKMKMKVKMEVSATSTIDLDPKDTQNFEGVQKEFIKLAHSIGEIDEINTRASEMLYRSCYLLRWVAFESFLRDSIYELYRSNPKSVLLSKNRKGNKISYEDLLMMSDEFRSIEALLENMIEKEIQQQESEGKSIHGLINFLKEEFLNKQDPYVSNYVYKGESKKTHYTDLIMLKDTRNVLMHEAGYYSPNFISSYPDIPTRDGMVIITSEFYLKAKLIIDSIAHRITDLINKSIELNQED